MAAIGSIVVGFDLDAAVLEMYDIGVALRAMVELVPGYDRCEAENLKDEIVDTMVGWLDAEK